MITQVNEIVKVVAVFGDGQKIRPTYFLWKNKRYKISQVTYTWTSWEGKAKVHHFLVTDTNDNLFSLDYNSESMAWTLVHVETEG